MPILAKMAHTNHHDVNACDVPRQVNNTRDEYTSAGVVLYRVMPPSNEVQFLMLRSPQGNWLPPKGGNEGRDQSLFDTALREVAEEAGIHPNDYTVHKDFGSRSFQCYIASTNVVKTVHYWLGRLNDPFTCFVFLSHEHTAFDWLPRDAACQLIPDYRSDMRQILHDMHTYITTGKQRRTDHQPPT